jgi:hypothetical protein
MGASVTSAWSTADWWQSPAARPSAIGPLTVSLAQPPSEPTYNGLDLSGDTSILRGMRSALLRLQRPIIPRDVWVGRL